MTIGGFIVGMVMMILGFFAVARTNWFLENMGDVSQIFGLQNAQWFSWKLVGIILLVLGFMIAFGLFELFFLSVLGGLFGLNR